MKLKPNVSPPALKIPKYDSERLKALKEILKEWEVKGIIKRGETEFVYAPVIVPKKNSDKKFRVCYNF